MEAAVLKLLRLVDHEPLCVGKFKDFGEEWVTACLGAEGALHFACMEKLVLVNRFAINRHAQEIHTRGFGDDSVHDRPEAESRLAVTEHRARVQEFFQGSEVGVADLTALIVCIGIVHAHFALTSSS